MGYNDDFAYILSAVGLERTGHMVYDGWATATLGWMMFYGALVIRLFGFSFVHIDAAMLPFGMACAALMHRIFVRLGLRSAEAAFGTLTLILSLIFVPLAFSFMTDVPGLFVFTLCFYLCQRALVARTPGIASAWLVAAALSNAIGGTVRQFDWIGLFVMVPVVLWCFRRQRKVWIPGGVAWLGSLAFVRSFLHWFSRQPYSLRENYLQTLPPPARAASNVLASVLIMGLFLLPITIAFLMPRRTRPGVAAGAAVAGCGITFAIARFAPDWLAPFQSDALDVSGLTIPSILGSRPAVLTHPIRMVLTALTISSLAAVLACLAGRLLRQPRRRIVLSPAHALVAFTLLATVVLTFVRHLAFTRYYLSMLVLIVPMLLRLYRADLGTDAAEGGGQVAIPRLGMAVLALFTAFTVAAVHDHYATLRARLAAANELIARGYSRDRFRAGFEYDGWTQIVKTGTLNDNRLGPPTAVYRVPPAPRGAPECNLWFAAYTPDIHAEVVLAYADHPSCGPQVPGLEPLHYRTWFPPQNRYLYFLVVPQA